MQYQSLLFSKFEQISANVVFATLLLYFGYPRKSIFSSSVINFLLTEREGSTGEYWPEVVAVRTERSEVRTKTTKRSPASEVTKLFITVYGFLITFCFVFASP